MADRIVRILDTSTGTNVDIRVIDNGDGTYSQDTSNRVIGKIDDEAIVDDIEGTLSGKLRGLLKKVSIPNALRSTLDSVSTNSSGDFIMYEGKACYTFNVKANIAQSQTDSSLVTRVAGKRIRVLQAVCQAGTNATDLTFNSKPTGSAGTAISPVFQNGVNSGVLLPYTEHGWFVTNLYESLTVTTGAGATTGILLKCVYI